MQDITTRQWFDPRTVTVVVNSNVPTVFDKLDLVRLSGAPSNSKLTVNFTGLFIALTVEHPALRKLFREIYYDMNDDCWAIYNRHFRIHESYWGLDLAARSIATQVLCAQRVGVGKLSAEAKGNHDTARRLNASEKWAGYWVWPRLGFDADIPASVRPRLSPRLRTLRKISELIMSKEGEEQWYLHGETVNVEFDTHPDSRSCRTLERYLRKRNIRVLP